MSGRRAFICGTFDIALLNVFNNKFSRIYSLQYYVHFRLKIKQSHSALNAIQLITIILIAEYNIIF